MGLLTVVRQLVNLTALTALCPTNAYLSDARARAWRDVRRVAGGRVPLGQVERVVNAHAHARLARLLGHRAAANTVVYVDAHAEAA